MRTKILLWIFPCLFFGISLSSNAQTMKKESAFPQMFPQGAENPPVNSRYFIGRSYLAPLTRNKALNCPVYNVTFEPGCRNNWHSHTGGQLLIVTAGRGYYQERGKAARELHPGDVVEIAPNVEHWHGAAPDSWFSHLAVECNPQTNQNSWLEPVDDHQYAAATKKSTPVSRLSEEALQNLSAWQIDDSLLRTDPELAEVFGNFAFDETQRYGDLDLKHRILVTMACAVVLHSEGLFQMTLRAAFANGITPTEIKETLYQAVPYAGMAKVCDFLAMANAFLMENGVVMPLPSQSTTTPESRLEKGLACQKAIFGDAIDRLYETSPADQIHIQKALSGNCFGDYVTREGLDLKTREMLTFAILVSMGGCEPQVKSHIQANQTVGNTKKTLLAVATQLLPYIGYPRTLNAIACVNEVIPE